MNWSPIAGVFTTATVILFALLPAPASARNDPDLLTVGEGYFDVRSSHNNAITYRLEYRSGYQIVPYVKPYVGFLGTSKQAYYINSGLLADIPLRDVAPETPILRHFFLTVIGGVGYYNHGDGKDLYNDVIFRVGAELSYELESKARIGITFHHISNANLGSRNPGAEMIGLFFSVPIGRLF